jgi:hypothetical protein
VDKAKWAHLDIAGPVWDDAKGATGMHMLNSPLCSDLYFIYTRTMKRRRRVLTIIK